MSTNLNRLLLCGAAATLVLVAGCEELDQAAGDAPQKGPTPLQQQFLPPDMNQPQPTRNNSAPVAQSPSNQQQPTAASSAAAPAATPADDAPTTLQPGDATNPYLEKATAGVGKQGRGYGGGIITTPVREYFIGRQAIVFDIQIPHEMQLYKAMNGRFPRDYAEFERTILKPAEIELPELPFDQKYMYDPKTGELLVGPKGLP